jgi:hypothetical protein
MAFPMDHKPEHSGSMVLSQTRIWTQSKKPDARLLPTPHREQLAAREDWPLRRLGLFPSWICVQKPGGFLTLL